MIERHLPENRRREAARAADYANRCRAALEHAKQISAVFIGASPRRGDSELDVTMIAQKQLVLMLTAELAEAQRLADRMATKLSA